MVRIMEKTGDGYTFIDTPNFVRRQEAMKYLKDKKTANSHGLYSGDEFLIVGSPTVVTTQSETRITLKSTSVGAGSNLARRGAK